MSSINADIIKAQQQRRRMKNNPKGNQAFDGRTTHGVLGRSALHDLPYFNMIRDTVLDMMHVTSGVVGHHLVLLTQGAADGGGAERGGGRECTRSSRGECAKGDGES